MKLLVLCLALIHAFLLTRSDLTAKAQAEPVPVAFNADDDDRDGLRDYEDDRLNGLEDLADVAIALLPAGEGPITITTDAPVGAVRLFPATDQKIEFSGLSGETMKLPAGLDSAADAILVEACRPRGLPEAAPWDGRFTVTATRLDGASLTSEFRVAPLLVRPGTARASQVFVREFPGRNDRMIKQLCEFCTVAKAELHVVPAGEPYDYNHIWLQDAVELLSSEVVRGPFTPEGWSMTISLAANRQRAIDLFPRDRLLGPGVGWIQIGEYRKAYAQGDGAASWIDWYGNLEASPPTDAYPNGRVLYGVDEKLHAQMHPSVVNFLTAQEAQAPVPLDVGWLTIKHVDEMVSFIPAKQGGFFVAVPDPTAAIEILKALQRSGQGALPMLDLFEEDVTVDSLLADQQFLDANQRLWRERIEPMAIALCQSIGVSADRLKRLPVLFHSNGLPRTPNVVNCLVVNGHVAMADPNGPKPDGVDAFQTEVRRRLSDADVTIHFVDDQQYHMWSGNVHCATNALRPIE